MHIKLDTRTLGTALGYAIRGTAARATLPILGHVLFTCAQDTLRLIGTDLELAVSVTLPAPFAEPGALAVPAKTISEIIHALPPGEVTLSTDEQRLTVQAGKSKYTIGGLPEGEYPMLPTVDGAAVTMAGADLKAMMHRGAYAVSTDDSRVILTGINLVAEESSLTLVSTDTHRLAVISKAGAFPRGSWIIPGRAVKEILRLLDTDPATLLFGENRMSVTVNGVTLVSRLIEGMFPAFQRVVPADATPRCTVNRVALLTAAKRASIVARAEANKLILGRDDDLLTIRAATGEVGEASEAIPATWHADGQSFGINAEYLLDACEASGAETLTLAQGTELQPLLITDGDPAWKSIIMPMQIL